MKRTAFIILAFILNFLPIPVGIIFSSYAQPVRLLEGDRPDPSIVRSGAVYYMTHSSFVYSPGLIVYKSSDLLNWTQCSVALPDYVGDVWAPDICKVGGRFYIYFPVRTAAGKRTNMVVWTDNPEGAWSKAVDLNVGSIDPEHITDEHGNRFLLVGGGNLYPLAADGLSITGQPTKIYDGWKIPDEFDIESVSLEGINLKKTGKYWYLLAAEGGTAGPPTGHLIVQARAETLKGVYENAPSNPLVRALSPAEKWWSTGHGSLVDTPDGRLFMLYHAYEKDFLTLGRQTLIDEVEIGKDGWIKVKNKNSLQSKDIVRRVSQSFSDVVFQSFKTDYKSIFTVNQNNIILNATGKTLSPALFHAGAQRYEITAQFEFDETATTGITFFYNENYNIGVACKQDGVYRLRRGEFGNRNAKIPIPAENGKCRVWLRLRNIDHIVTGWFSSDNANWHKCDWGFYSAGFEHNVLYGFLSLRPGFFATGEGKAEVKSFEYKILE